MTDQKNKFMKLLLTSGGITNETLKKAFSEMAPKPLAECSLAFILTAANIEEDKSWMEEDIENFKKSGVKEVMMVDIEKMKKEQWFSLLESSNIICVGGGNTYHLLNWVRKSGLADKLKELLKTRLYVGISAGSIIPGPDISFNGDLFPEEEKGDLVDLSGLNYVSFVVAPHYLSPHFSDTKDENILELSKKLDHPIYAIDDDTAIVVEDGKTKVISEGKWKKYN
ncbi:MAG: Type 1 glutamine amidotransferase-like domain-containing protein [Patescibacteria group bacterium]